MQTDEFNWIVEQRLDKTLSTLCKKADEYARGDRLSNFMQLSGLLNISPEASLIGLVSKHYIALIDFIHDIDSGTVQPYERWDEKIGDIIAYMCLLDAIVLERGKELHFSHQTRHNGR